MFNKQIKKILQQGFLIAPDILPLLANKDEDFFKKLQYLKSNKVVVLTKDLIDLVDRLPLEKLSSLNLKQLEILRGLFEKGKIKEEYFNFLNSIELFQESKPHEEKEVFENEMPSNELGKANYSVLLNYPIKAKKHTVEDFVNSFNTRFEFLSNLLRQRPELSNAISIKRLYSRQNNEDISIIGLISNKYESTKGSIIFEVEDQTGSTKVIVPKTNPDLYAFARDLVLDAVVGFSGRVFNRMVVANNIVLPSFPPKPLKKFDKDIYLAFIGDTHFGSALFLEEEFKKMIDWLNLKRGSKEHLDVAKKIKYLFITGDVVEGVGIYPGQEEELAIKDIYEQYEVAARWLEKIPKHITIFIIPGNHDATRLEEPQVAISKKYAKPLYELENVVMLSSPSLIRLEESNDFPGFDVLMYHGNSFIYYAENVESIRQAGGQKRIDLVMKYLFDLRHLGPTHGSVSNLPEEDDALLLKKIPDFFVSGHVHRVTAKNFKGVTLINSSCWTDISSDQIKRGLEPQPARVVVTSLKTREIKIYNFMKQKNG